MSDRNSEVERLCQAALDRPVADRPALLDEACRGDTWLRQEVESLLALEAVSERFIEKPAADIAAGQSGAVPMIQPGCRLGPYEVRSAIGAGGMGEVYRARDTRLQRDVALKVLPRELALDAERVRRFQREAEALASLNHPNIAAIYGLEEANGIQALILELVEGPTLADRIVEGPIPIEDALAIARQLTDGLEAAHKRGIIHRDMKPANVKVRRDGVAKLLDFGLAKMMETQAGGSDSAPGVLLGTPAYMAPEQLKGQPVDRRADVWGLGCVLFEMLAGRAAFEGDTNGEVAAEVLKSDPEWQQLPAATPESIRHLLRRCLNKDPGHRVHDMADVRIELEDASSSPPTRVQPVSRTWIVAIALAAAALAATATATWLMRGAQSSPAMRETRVEMMAQPTTDPTSLAVSPDGRNVVFAATFEGRSRLWLRTLDGSVARPLSGTDFAAHPFWSPDGRSIGYFADLRLKRLDLDGGTVQPLARIEVGFGGTWTEDGAILFSSGPARPIFRVADTGGEAVPVTHVAPPQTGHRFPYALPDGRHMLYYVTGASESSGVYVADVDGSDARRLFAADSAATYTSSGHLLFVRQGTLYAVPFDPGKLSVAGSPFSIADRVAVDSGLGIAAVSASASGLIAYRKSSTIGKQQFIWFDRKGREVSRLGDPGDTGPAHPSLSHGGDRVAVTRAQGANPDVWLLDVTHSRATRFTLNPSTDIYPIWSPDGDQIIFGSNRRGRWGLELYRKPTATGKGDELLTIDGMLTVMPEDWSPDGRFIIFRGLRDTKASFDLWALPLQAPERKFVVVQTEFESATRSSRRMDGGSPTTPTNRAVSKCTSSHS